MATIPKRKMLKDLKKKLSNANTEGSALIETMTTLNDNMLFIQRNQCEQEAYLLLIADKLNISKEEIKEKMDLIQIELDE